MGNSGLTSVGVMLVLLSSVVSPYCKIFIDVFSCLYKVNLMYKLTIGALYYIGATFSALYYSVALYVQCH